MAAAPRGTVVGAAKALLEEVEPEPDSEAPDWVAEGLELVAAVEETITAEPGASLPQRSPMLGLHLFCSWALSVLPVIQFWYSMLQMLVGIVPA